MAVARHRLPGELVFALAMLLFGLTALWLAWRIAGFSSWSSPGVFPMLAAAAMSAAGIVVVRNSLRMKPVDIPPGSTLGRQFAHRVLPLPIVLFTVLIVAYMLALERAGFLLSSFVYLVASMVALGERRIVRAVAISAVSLAAIYVVFQTVFSVVLPEGVIEKAFK